MKINLFIQLALVFCIFSKSYADDTYQWLEEINSDKSMEWVNKTNKMTDEKLKNTGLYKELYLQALTVLNGKSRLPSITQNGKWLYNFWQDKDHPRGIYRRTTLAEIKKQNPKWELVLDMDKYSIDHEKNYDYKGMTCLPPKGNNCLVRLSPSGGDAVEIREFDLEKLVFVEGGFELPLAKSQVTWVDKNTVYVGTDFGIDSMTDSGYPRFIKKWKRGTSLSESENIYSADRKSMSANIARIENNKSPIEIIYEATGFWSSNKFQLINNKLMPLSLPKSASISGFYNGKLVASLKENWDFNRHSYLQGEVLLIDLSLLRGEKGDVESIIRPNEKTVIESVNTTQHGLLITVLEDVKARLKLFKKLKDDSWKVQEIQFPENGSLNVTSVDEKTGDFFVEYESFVSPPSLYHVNLKNLKPEIIKQQAESFDGSQFQAKQYFTQSKDGTKVPYFVVMNKNTKYNGKNPTHMFSYGGFRNSLTPSYSGSYEALSGAYGKLWLERGGVFVLANIRGGGEYGPAWHAAALLKNRHKSFEDFEAVTRDLIDKKITSAKHLGIEGRSNGGLLVTATMTRHPELYGAVICGAPLIDMKRYNKLLAGASWMGEYGNPDDNEMWEYIKTYSPYQNLKEKSQYPPIFFYTSTQDDRVHPGHARKMAAKMIEYNYDVDYYENIEGGHYGFSTNKQLAHRLALSYTHLWTHLE